MQPCAKVQTSSSVVPLGSPVTATCVIRDDCPLVIGQAVHIEWRLDDGFIPSSPEASESGMISKVVIPNFNHSRAFLTCCVQASPIQVVGGVEIRAGCEDNLKLAVFVLPHLLVGDQMNLHLSLFHLLKNKLERKEDQPQHDK